MNFIEYQNQSKTTAIYPRPQEDFTDYSMDCLTENINNTLDIVPVMYCALGLAGESGEVTEQVKKSWRNNMKITDDRREKIKDELGDVLWYTSQLATELDLDLNEIAINNLAKLFARKSAGDLKHE